MPSAIPNRKTVLFVDDDAQFLELLQPLMERISRGEWEVLVAADSGAALSALESRPVDLVVLDVRMPEVDGLQLLNLIHRKQPQLKKAILSGHIDEACRSAAFTGGADLVLEKPHDTAGYEALCAALNELLRLSPPQRSIAAPTINELVVCSKQGEPLYAAQSPNAHDRCALCVDLMEAGARLHALLPLGALERVEFVSVSGRMIARIQDGNGIFLRTSDQ